ncbi:MAG: ATP-binding cassette domain-containing protein [Burkholderiaceae bacterium]
MIHTQGLRFRYRSGPEIAFGDVAVGQGETLLLRGASGAGKSTWLALVAGLLTATSGEVIVAGQELGVMPPARRDAWRAKNLGFLPQKLHLSEALTVRGNLALAYFAAGLDEDEAAIGETLGALGVAQLAHRKPAQLSGGQAQRVALARAVLLCPKVLLADEPTASLDDHYAAAAVKLLQESAVRCGATLVIATHDRRVTEALPGAHLHRLPSPEQGAA